MLDLTSHHDKLVAGALVGEVGHPQLPLSTGLVVAVVVGAGQDGADGTDAGRRHRRSGEGGEGGGGNRDAHVLGRDADDGDVAAEPKEEDGDDAED